MGNSKILVYDGSFNGFLTAIYVAFEQKIRVSDIQGNTVGQNGLFSETETIFTDMDKAKRVWNGIQEKSTSAIRNVYFAYLSEYEGIEQLLYRYVRQLFVNEEYEFAPNADGIALKVRQLAKQVSREKERLESFIGFSLTYDEVYFSTLKPEYNVLPLLSRHLRSRWPHQQWIVYDQKRKYGLFYNLRSVEIITLDLPLKSGTGTAGKNQFSSAPYHEQGALVDYFGVHGILSHIKGKLYAQEATKHYLEKRAV